MANTKISGLTAVTTPVSTDEFAVNQGGTTKKMTRAQVHKTESNETLSLGGLMLQTLVTTLANDATPNVTAGNLFKTGGTTTITDFDLGVVGQTITILSAHAITITDGSPIILAGGADYVMGDSDVLVLTMFNDQVWQEVSRSVN